MEIKTTSFVYRARDKCVSYDQLLDGIAETSVHAIDRYSIVDNRHYRKYVQEDSSISSNTIIRVENHNSMQVQGDKHDSTNRKQNKGAN